MNSQAEPQYILKHLDNQKLANLAQEHPELVRAPAPLNFTPDILKKVGIHYDHVPLGQGYIKLFAQDFIVEEITTDLQIMSVEPASTEVPVPAGEAKRPKLEATMIKMGLETNEAIERLAQALGCAPADIAYSGLKDTKALTAQRLTFDRVNPDLIPGISIPYLRLQGFKWRSSIEQRGNLYGNRFTILIRTGTQIDQQQLQSRLLEIEQVGFPNFFSLQRFGPRLNTHLIGRLIVHGYFEAAIRELLVGVSSHELPVFQELRQEAAKNWGNWQAMSEIYAQYPALLHNELDTLTSLQRHNGNWAESLRSIEYQTRFCCYAYFSYWFNRLLTQRLSQGELPDKLPLYHPDAAQDYAGIFPDSERQGLKFRLAELPFLRLNQVQTIPTMAKPKIWSVTPIEGGLIFHFDLRKGSYATSLLSSVFELYQAKPTPEWVNQDVVDIRQPLGYQPVSTTLDQLPKSDLVDDVLSEIA